MREKRSFVSWVSLAVLVSAMAAPVSREEVLAPAFGAEKVISWRSTITGAENLSGRPVSIGGKSEKNGLTALTLRFGDRTIEAYMLGNKAFVTSPDRKWKNVPEMRKGESPGQFMHRMVRSVPLPAEQIRHLAGGTTALQREGDVVSGDLAEVPAKILVQEQKTGERGHDKVENASGQVRFWMKEGKVQKYEYTVRGTVDSAGVMKDVEATTTVEFIEGDTTKVVIPEKAREKLGIKD